MLTPVQLSAAARSGAVQSHRAASVAIEAAVSAAMRAEANVSEHDRNMYAVSHGMFVRCLHALFMSARVW